MLRNYLAVVLRNLAREKLYAGINIAGLGIGFAAAILIALFIRDELSYDRFLADHDRIYRLYSMFAIPQGSPQEIDGSLAQISALVKLRVPGVESLARISYAEERSIRHDGKEFIEQVHWADPNLFDILRFPALAGDPQSALSRPDGVIITREIARKYFGRDDPIGEILELDRKHSLRVAAVLLDLPSNTTFDARIVVSGLASFSQIAFFEALTSGAEPNTTTWMPTYVKAAPGASLQQIQNALINFIGARPELLTVGGARLSLDLKLLPITAVHRHRSAANSAFDPTPDAAALYALGAIGLLIVLSAAINFVNLMTARAEQRAVEVGIRKAAGAHRYQLIAQFVTESQLYAIFGLILALAITELLLPAYNGFLGRNMALSYVQNPGVLLIIFASTFFAGTLAGVYPAILLADGQPMGALKGKIPTTKSGVVRHSLVVLQFAALIGLLLMTGIIYRQTLFATSEASNPQRVAYALGES